MKYKYKKINIKLLNQKSLFGLLAITAIAIIIVYSFIEQSKRQIKETPSGPTQSDQIYLDERAKQCPFWSSNLESETGDYKVIEYSCAYLDNPNDKTGEFIKVMLSTQGFGKDGFNKMLLNQNILNNPQLHIEFVN